MHSRIYVISKDKDANIEDFNLEWIDEPQFLHPSVDYISDSMDGDDDIKWLEDTYKIQVESKNNIRRVNRENIDKWKKSLRKMCHKNLKEVYTKLEKIISNGEECDALDLARLSRIIYPRLGFYFAVDEGTSICNDPELLDWLEIEKPSELYIIHVYDYHF